jgi:ferritin-like metal-binding protein YciE
MKGLIEEGEGIIEAEGANDVKDAALIGAAQRVEHYEIAAYGTVREFARNLGHEDAARALDMTLHEEGDADKELSRIAKGTFFESGVNEGAMS